MLHHTARSLVPQLHSVILSIITVNPSLCSFGSEGIVLACSGTNVFGSSCASRIKPQTRSNAIWTASRGTSPAFVEELAGDALQPG